MMGMVAAMVFFSPAYAGERPNEITRQAADALDSTFMIYNHLLLKIQHKQQKVDMLQAQLWKAIEDIKTYDAAQGKQTDGTMPDSHALSAYADVRRDYEYALSELGGYKNGLAQVEATLDVQQQEYMRVSAAGR